jgi:mutator protein MutT
VTDSRREFPDRPIVGVGAVIIDGDRVLLVRRANEPLKGEWSLPGGAVELGETLREAIAREVLEETGLSVEVGPVVDVLDRIRVDDDSRVRFHYVLVDFVCRPVGGALSCASDADDAAWARLDDLQAYRVAEATVSVIRDAFRIRDRARLDDARVSVSAENPRK